MHVSALSPDFCLGIPDQHFQSEDGSHFIESKFERKAVPGLQKAKYAKLSPKQYNWIQECIAAGGTAAWLVCKKMDRGEWQLRMGTTRKLTGKHEIIATRYTGEKFIIQSILAVARRLSHDRRDDLGLATEG